MLNVVTDMHRRTAGSELSVTLTTKDPVAEPILETLERIVAVKQVKSRRQHPYMELSDEKGTFTLWAAAHPVVFQEQQALRDKDWETALESILSHKDVILEISDSLEEDLKDLVGRLRKGLGLGDRIRQTFSAALNVVPATAAVTYILSTGDAVGASGIQVKLAGLFGLNDLYALIAIPATVGLRKADQQQIEDMLGPIAQAWLNDKLESIRTLFEKEITGGIIRSAQDAINEADRLTEKIRTHIEICENALESGKWDIPN